MKNLLKLTATVSLIALAGCSSSGDSTSLSALNPLAEETVATQPDETTVSTDGGTSSSENNTDTASETASSADDTVATQPDETAASNENNDATPTLAGDTAFETARAGIQSLPEFNLEDEDDDVDSAPIPVSNLDQSVGRATGEELDNRTFRVNVNGQEFDFPVENRSANFINSSDPNYQVSANRDALLIDGAFAGLPDTQHSFIDLFAIGEGFSVTSDDDVAPGADEITNISVVLGGSLTPVEDLPSSATYSGQYIITNPDRFTDPERNRTSSGDFTAKQLLGKKIALKVAYSIAITTIMM